MLAARYDRSRVLRFSHGDAVQRVALLDRVDHILPLGHLTEHRVLAVEPIGHYMRDEELAAVGVRTRVGHRKAADLVLAGIVFHFVFELVARSAAPAAGRISALN